MPHQLLLHFHGCPSLVEKGAIGMAESVPTDLPDSEFFTSRSDVILADFAGVIRFSCRWIWEQPALALVGMGAVFAGMVRAPMTSLLMIFEMTQDKAVIVPLMISNLVSLFQRGWLCGQNWCRRRSRCGILETPRLVRVSKIRGTDNNSS
jgi:hypothetical protein